MKNDIIKDFFNDIAPVPYSKEFTERVMRNLNYRIPVPFSRIFLLLLLWGGVIYAVLDNPELVLNNLELILSIGDVNKADLSSYNVYVSGFGSLINFCLRMLLLMGTLVLLSVFIVYDSMTVAFDNITRNLIQEERL